MYFLLGANSSIVDIMVNNQGNEPILDNYPLFFDILRHLDSNPIDLTILKRYRAIEHRPESPEHPFDCHLSRSEKIALYRHGSVMSQGCRNKAPAAAGAEVFTIPTKFSAETKVSAAWAACPYAS